MSMAELGLPEATALVIDQGTETEMDFLLLTSSLEDLLNREEIMVSGPGSARYYCAVPAVLPGLKQGRRRGE